MSENPFDLQRLQQQIATTAARMKGNLVTTDKDAAAHEQALLYTGGVHHTVPHALLFHSELPATAKTLWQVMRALVTQQGAFVESPRREDLALAVPCTPQTITVVRNQLRLYRWITFGQRVRRNGRIVGDIYLLHDQVLPLYETMLIDPTYAKFVQDVVEGTTKVGKQVASRAHSVLGEIEMLDQNYSTPLLHSLATRDELSLYPTKPAVEQYPRATAADLSKPVPTYSLGGSFANPVEQMNIDSHSKKSSLDYSENSDIDQSENSSLEVNLEKPSNHAGLEGSGNQDEIFTLDHHSKKSSYGSSGCSSSINSITTAHENQANTDKGLSITRSAHAISSDPLAYDHEEMLAIFEQYMPSLAKHRLTPRAMQAFSNRFNHLATISLRISRLPKDLQPLIAYQLIGRLWAALSGQQEPIRNLPGFTTSLIKRAETGEFALDEYGEMTRSCFVENEVCHLLGETYQRELQPEDGLCDLLIGVSS